MITYKVGCLIAAAKSGEVRVIAHQANCFNTMKSGIAPIIAKTFPEALEVDQQTTKGDIGKLGGFTGALSMEHGVLVYNLYGQYKYSRSKRDTNYNALRMSMEAMRDDLEGIRIKPPIGLPKLGAGLGGGDWDIISSIIEDVFKDYSVTIYVLDEKEI